MALFHRTNRGRFCNAIASLALGKLSVLLHIAGQHRLGRLLTFTRTSRWDRLESLAAFVFK